MQALPKISVVIPSMNQGRFIRQTIDSILGQQYANLEIIVRDGGSKDDTVDILKSYGNAIASWVSEKDSGQSGAINDGFALATGDILGWLNSDDMYLPQTLQRISALMAGALDKPQLVYGGCIFFREKVAQAFGWLPPAYDANRLTYDDYIVQPSSFWTRALWNACGPLSPTCHYAFDWEWFIRASKICDFQQYQDYLSMYRFHEAHKSGTGGEKRAAEILQIVEKYSSRDWSDAFVDVHRNLGRLQSRRKLLKSLRLARIERFSHPWLRFKHGKRLSTAESMLRGTT